MKIGRISVTLLDAMGDDLTVVNAARVSMDKHHKHFKDGDERLIKYLAKHGHWSPFAHPQTSFVIEAPIFVARQLVKHHVGLSFNEVSRRYVDDEPEFYVPEMRERAPNVKQGSQDVTIIDSASATGALIESYKVALNTYEFLLHKGVAPEVARSALPVGCMTKWVWTGSLYAFARVCKQRLDAHAQAESRQVAKAIARHLASRFPVSYAALVGEEK